jgi:hypothetical protein
VKPAEPKPGPKEEAKKVPAPKVVEKKEEKKVAAPAKDKGLNSNEPKVMKGKKKTEDEPPKVKEAPSTLYSKLKRMELRM